MAEIHLIERISHSTAILGWIGPWEIIILLVFFTVFLAVIVTIVLLIAKVQSSNKPGQSAILRCLCGCDLKNAIREGRTACPKCGRDFTE